MVFDSSNEMGIITMAKTIVFADNKFRGFIYGKNKKFAW
jgi:hypothetical protein